MIISRQSIQLKRVYENLIQDHFDQNKQMVFLAGPRQVGKTAITRSLAAQAESSLYRSWHSVEDQIRLTQLSYAPLLEGLVLIPGTRPLLILESIDRFTGWKNYVRGLYDTYEERLNILLTGTSPFSQKDKEGESLIGRYFTYRIHPLSLGENPDRPASLFQDPQEISQKEIDHLLHFGGFPEPWSRGEDHFLHQWRTLHQQHLIYEESRTVETINNLNQLDLLANILSYQVGEFLNATELSTRIRTSVPTIQRWIQVLEQIHFCYTLTPWSLDISRSLLKIPKVYLWDWSALPRTTAEEQNKRHENFVASHLLKAVHYWTDRGFGTFSLHYIATKDKKKVDFVIIKDGVPWMLVDVKDSASSFLSTTLQEFQERLGCPYAFQIAFDLPFTDKPAQWLSLMIATNKKTPATILPAGVFLSILV